VMLLLGHPFIIRDQRGRDLDIRQPPDPRISFRGRRAVWT
jgi:hypothetical protein